MSTKNHKIFWDANSDPSNPGWVLRYDTDHQQNLTEPLDCTDEADVDEARREAAVWAGVSTDAIAIEP